MAATDFIRISNLSHRFVDGHPGLDNINLIIARGEAVVVLGKNGSGKTTLLRCLNGLILPKKGRVMINGLDVAKHPKKARKMVGLVFQDADAQIVGETVWDDAAFGPENLGFSRDEIQNRVDEALASVGLLDLAQKSPHRLSGGEKRRLAVAGVLAMGPEAVAMDEPFSNLDYPGCLQVKDQLWRLKRAGCTLVVATHQLAMVMDVADRLVVLDKGAVVLDGPPDQVGPGVGEFGVCPVSGRTITPMRAAGG